MADKKLMPIMLTDETWEGTKKQIEKSIAQFIENKIEKGKN
jgi:predicted GTPase